MHRKQAPAAIPRAPWSTSTLNGLTGLRTHHHADFPPPRVAAEREASISVCLPARNEIATIGPIVEALLSLLEVDAIDQLVVVDDSDDGTGQLARRLGADVYDQSALCPELGVVQGKGDAMWRALSVLSGDVVCYLDADSGLFGAHYATGLAGAVALPGPTSFAKAFYRRPFCDGATVDPNGGGRVTELTARPLLRAFFPELAAIEQPLAGEIALRRQLAEALRFPLGYGVDVALLIDAWGLEGADRLAQVDLDARQNRHRPLHQLAPMATEVTQAILQRAREHGRLLKGTPNTAQDRPPGQAHREPHPSTIPCQQRGQAQRQPSRLTASLT